jgi:hypothetical protein
MIKIIGENIQNKKKKNPKIKQKALKIKPKKIMKILTSAPSILEIKFETKTSNISPKSKPLFVFIQTVPFQGAKRVFKRSTIEK